MQINTYNLLTDDNEILYPPSLSYFILNLPFTNRLGN